MKYESDSLIRFESRVASVKDKPQYEASELIRKQTEEFLAKGGVIKVLEPCVRVEIPIVNRFSINMED